MEKLSRKAEVSETTPLILKPQQSSWVKNLKIWALGIGAVAVSVTTAFPVAIIDSWKKSGIFSFKNGIHDLVKNPLLFINPEITTTVLVTSAYKTIEKSFDSLVDKNISKTSKVKSVIKNQIFSLILIAINENVKKINKKLTTSSSIDIDIFDDLLPTIVLNFGQEISIFIIWKVFELWVKEIKGLDFYSIGVPILSTIGYCLFNFLQTVYNLGKNNVLLEEFIKTFLPILTENTVNGSFRIASSSLMYAQINLRISKQANIEITNVPFDEIMADEINGNNSAEQLWNNSSEICEVVVKQLLSEVVSNSSDLISFSFENDRSLSEKAVEYEKKLQAEPSNQGCPLTA